MAEAVYVFPRRVTTSDFHAMFPALSNARMMIVFVPVYSGIGPACQSTAPLATPESPAVVNQTTCFTPPESAA